MNINNVLYYVDSAAKFYFDVKVIRIIKDLKCKQPLYECEILYNNYKFNDNNFKPNFSLKGKKDIFSILSLVNTIDEAERMIK